MLEIRGRAKTKALKAKEPSRSNLCLLKTKGSVQALVVKGDIKEWKKLRRGGVVLIEGLSRAEALKARLELQEKIDEGAENAKPWLGSGI